jgi:hypothetical protein
MSPPARPLLLLCVLAATLTVAGTVATPAAHTAQNQPNRPPTVLWKSYPLQQHPRAVVPRVAKLSGLPQREAIRQTASQSSRQFQSLLLASVLVATLLAMATIVLLRSSIPVRVGTSLRGGVRASSPRPVRRAKPRNPSAKRTQRSRVAEVTADSAEPQTPPAEVTEPDPKPERGLLEVLQLQPEENVERTVEAMLPQPGPALEQTQEPVLELQLRELVKRKHAARAAARPQLEREIEALRAEIKTRRAKAPRPEAAVSRARCEIGLWRGYAKSQLYATLAGSSQVYAVSRFFRLRDELVPTEHAQRALAALLEELEQNGWSVVSGGRPWSRHTLELFAREAGDP